MLSDDIKKKIEYLKNPDNFIIDKEDKCYQRASSISRLQEYLPRIQSLEKELKAEKDKNGSLIWKLSLEKKINETSKKIEKALNKIIDQLQKDKQELAEALKDLITNIECYNMLSCKQEKLLIEKHYNKKWEEL